MNIIMLGCRGVPATYGGVEKVVEELAARFVKKGHKVSVICRNHYTPKMNVFKGIKIIRIPTVNQKHLEMIVHTVIASLYLLLKKYDIVHIHSVDPALLTPILKLRHPVVATSHGQAYRRDKWGKLAKTMSKFAERVFICSAHLCTAVSKTLTDYYLYKYGREVKYIPNGIEFRDIEDFDLIKRFGIEKDKYILYVGRLIPTKGPKILIDAYKKINSETKLVFVGGSSHTDEYEKTLRKEANEKIMFLGYQHGRVLNALYDHCKLFVFPSQIEGLPIVLLESLCARKPVIFSDIPENMEIGNGLGISFRSGDSDDLGEKLSYALSNMEHFEIFKSKISEKLDKEYNWDFIAEQYIKAYQEIMPKKERTSA
ncbi:MAG: glycosyltransferase family 4 protein [Candidatus Hodarchaeota archaeon]